LPVADAAPIGLDRGIAFDLADACGLAGKGDAPVGVSAPSGVASFVG
jgi:hypothetical protein